MVDVTTDRPERRRLPTWLGPAALGVVVVVALVVGSSPGSSRPTTVQRAAALEAQIKCPSCEDLSVAQSSASSAITVRHEITQMMQAGQSDQQIENVLVARYGPTILLRPPTHGLTLLVWVIPAVAGAGALTGLGMVFFRRSSEMTRLRRGEQ
jgi:cytochrome c-type biogenesis protein CcmH